MHSLLDVGCHAVYRVWLHMAAYKSLDGQDWSASAFFKRVAAGDTFDVIIAPPAAVKQFAAAGKVEAGGVDVGRVGSGVAIRPGAPVPAIATGDDIKKTVLEAESIVFNTASTGLYFENLLKKWGIYEQVQGKAQGCFSTNAREAGKSIHGILQEARQIIHCVKITAIV